MKILVIEDNATIAFQVRSTLEQQGHDVHAIIARGEDALTLDLDPVELALVDVNLAGDLDGIDVVRILAARGIASVMLTGSDDDDTISRATAAGAFGFLAKPFRAHELRAQILMATRHAAIEMRLRERERDANIQRAEAERLRRELDALRAAVLAWTDK